MNTNQEIDAISFIVPVLNGEIYIERCLNSILSEMNPEHDEIIVVDNGSTDKTLSILGHYAEVKVLNRPLITIAEMRNSGAAEAKGKYLAFVDSDCTLIKGWRESVIKVFSDNNIGATGSHYYIPKTANWIEKAWGSNKKTVSGPVQWINTCNIIVRKDVFRAIGGFNASLKTDEDYDLGKRLNENNYIVFEEPKAGVIHYKNPNTIKKFVNREKWYASTISFRLSLDNIDKTLVMSLLFIVTSLLSIAGVVLSIMGKFNLIWVPIIFLSIPILTVGNRLYRFRNYRYAIPLLVLYVVYYSTRASMIIRRWFS
ncbi:MAG: glycosyltransferase [candidate division Zixibacteria bacterium]|nr:glycosyltransferase [candidate division Zixibacteria bacterium]